MLDYDASVVATILGLRARHPGWQVIRAGTSTWIAATQASGTARRVTAAHSLPTLARPLEAAENMAEPDPASSKCETCRDCDRRGSLPRLRVAHDTSARPGIAQ